MSIIAIVNISHPELALTPTIRALSGASVQVVPHSATDPETEQFFFLFECDEGQSWDALDDALADDPTVASATPVTASGETRIYRLSHTEGTKLISPRLTDLGGLMLEATSTRRGWKVRLQVPDREALSTLDDYCRDEGIQFDLLQMFRRDDEGVGGATTLTDAQREALTTAYREGYFTEPRETSLEELGEQLDISPTAVGGRIRRGTAELVDSTLIEDE